MLVRFIIPHIKYFKIIIKILWNLDRHLNWCLWLLDSSQVIPVPIVNAVFDITDTVDVAEDLEAAHFLAVGETLDLLLSVVV